MGRPVLSVQAPVAAQLLPGPNARSMIGRRRKETSSDGTVTWREGIYVSTLTHNPLRIDHYGSRPEVQQHPSSLETARLPSGPFLLMHPACGRGLVGSLRRPPRGVVG